MNIATQISFFVQYKYSEDKQWSNGHFHGFLSETDAITEFNRLKGLSGIIENNVKVRIVKMTETQEVVHSDE